MIKKFIKRILTEKTLGDVVKEIETTDKVDVNYNLEGNWHNKKFRLTVFVCYDSEMSLPLPFLLVEDYDKSMEKEVISELKTFDKYELLDMVTDGHYEMVGSRIKIAIKKG